MNPNAQLSLKMFLIMQGYKAAYTSGAVQGGCLTALLFGSFLFNFFFFSCFSKFLKQ